MEGKRSPLTRGRLILILVALALVVSFAARSFSTQSQTAEVTFSELSDRVEATPSEFSEVVFKPTNQEIEATLTDGTLIEVNYPSDEAQIAFQERLEAASIPFDSEGTGSSILGKIKSPTRMRIGSRARRSGPYASDAGRRGLWDLQLRQEPGETGQPRPAEGDPFADVAGADEAVEELHEIKEFLENPKKFRSLGARIPKGVLLAGPPGTGKTLLARAVAGEAGASFFSISGSDFVEMFVGVGASRVRDLFEQAKQISPAIILIDEIDAVGRHRGAGLGGGHDEREQTLNQLLVELDGFESTDTIIVIAATNRPDVLDPALLRPGRFDRQVMVDRPDRVGRQHILAVHSRGKPLSPEIDLDALAAGTPGFTGADLANLINEAALLSARRGKTLIEQSDLEEGSSGSSRAREENADPLRAGTKDHRISRDGSRLVGHYLPNADPIHKISIISRSRRLATRSRCRGRTSS